MSAPGPTPAFSLRVPPGEDRERRVCNGCGFVDYENPRVVVGVVAAWSPDGPAFGVDAVPLERVRILLCRRAIQPRRGYWTLPAGFMETGETVADGVRRETREEAGAELALDSMLAVYDLTGRSQVQILWRAGLVSPEVESGPESLEAALVPWPEIPWRSLAFHSVSWALLDFADSRLQTRIVPYGNPPGKAGWTLPDGV